MSWAGAVLASRFWHLAVNILDLIKTKAFSEKDLIYWRRPSTLRNVTCPCATSSPDPWSIPFVRNPSSPFTMKIKSMQAKLRDLIRLSLFLQTSTCLPRSPHINLFLHNLCSTVEIYGWHFNNSSSGLPSAARNCHILRSLTETTTKIFFLKLRNFDRKLCRRTTELFAQDVLQRIVCLTLESYIKAILHFISVITLLYIVPNCEPWCFLFVSILRFFSFPSFHEMFSWVGRGNRSHGKSYSCLDLFLKL